MSTANAWTHPANDPPRRPDAGWTLRPRLGFTDIITLLWGQKWLMAAIFIVIAATGVAFALKQKTEYVANAQLLIKIGDEHVYHPRSGQLGAGAITDIDAIVDPERGILHSAGLHRKVIERIGIQELFPEIGVGQSASEQESAMAQAVAEFGKRFESAQGVKMPTIPLSFSHENPEMAARALNALIEEFVSYRRTLLLSNTGPAVLWEKTSRADELNLLDERIQNFLDFNNIADFDTEKTALTNAKTVQVQRRYELSAALQEAQGRANASASALKSGAVPPEVVQSRDIDTTAQQELNKLNNQLAATQGAFLPGSVPVRQAEERIAAQTEATRRLPPPGALNIKMGINPTHQALDTDRNTTQSAAAGFDAALARVRANIGDIDSRLRELASLEPQYRNMMDERKNLAASISALDVQELESSASDAIASRSTDNVRVLSFANPPLEGSSKRKLIAGLALVMAAFTALCAGLLRVFLKPGLPTAVSAGRTLDLPVLATARVKA